ncbi:phytosulfokines-like [Malania oleifera]|uniref:phytosulfokines-like n=1 Tax=Malania oleifera TaxID=397392 RepID=UPI0025ADE85F|nr:phytosulfokines-like [Malania oleifera]
MAKLTALFMIALLLCFTAYAAATRSEPALAGGSLATTQSGVGEAGHAGGDESCEGLGEEECLKKRSLEAHLDYIYTQDVNKKP